MKSDTLKQAAKKYNAQIRKEIKVMHGGLVDTGKNKNKWLLKELKKLSA